MNPEQELDRIHGLLDRVLEDSGADGFVVGVSGGVDSATIARITEQEHDVFPVFLPGPSTTKKDEDCAHLATKGFSEPLMIKPIHDAYETFTQGLPMGEVVRGNLQARLRMVELYTIANEHNLLVLGTGNKSELMTGYFTKHGDGAVDVLPLGHLYKTEVYELAEHIGVPEAIIEREPSAGLWEGQTDEEELGMSYEKLDLILKDWEEPMGQMVEAIEAGEVDTEAFKHPLEMGDVDHVTALVADSEHKRELPPMLEREEDGQ